jgi:micrococcal nuclease
MTRIVIGLVVALTVSLATAAFSADPAILTGTVTHVRDGDTIEVGKMPIRLNGVSAPELKERLGQQSKQFMVDLVMGKRVRCVLNGKKTYDRFVGVCYLGGQDVGAAVIEAGLALDCAKFSSGQYKSYEKVLAREKIKLPQYCR